MTSPTITAYRERAEIANALLAVIATRGRQFFYHNGRVSRFEVDDRGRVLFVDKYCKARLYCHGTHALTSYHFTEGGTLRSLALSLRDFIRTGKHIKRFHFGPWPEWLSCGGDPWAYGEHAMQEIRDAAIDLGVCAKEQP